MSKWVCVILVVTATIATTTRLMGGIVVEGYMSIALSQERGSESSAQPISRPPRSIHGLLAVDGRAKSSVETPDAIGGVNDSRGSAFRPHVAFFATSEPVDTSGGGIEFTPDSLISDGLGLKPSEEVGRKSFSVSIFNVDAMSRFSFVNAGMGSWSSMSLAK